MVRQTTTPAGYWNSHTVAQHNLVEPPSHVGSIRGVVPSRSCCGYRNQNNIVPAVTQVISAFRSAINN